MGVVTQRQQDPRLDLYIFIPDNVSAPSTASFVRLCWRRRGNVGQISVPRSLIPVMYVEGTTGRRSRKGRRGESIYIEESGILMYAKGT